MPPPNDEASEVKLAVLARDMEHLRASVDSLRGMVENKLATKADITDFVSREHLEARLEKLSARMDALTAAQDAEKQAREKQSPRSLFRTLTEFAVGISALAAAAGVLAMLVRGGGK